ncbi:MAG: hypothetical protein AAFQ82_13305 [Myxococcota bacterium]
MRQSVEAVRALIEREGLLFGTGAAWWREPRRPVPGDFDIALDRSRVGTWLERFLRAGLRVERWQARLHKPLNDDQLAGYFYIRVFPDSGPHLDLAFREEVNAPRGVGVASPEQVRRMKWARGLERDIRWLETER